MLVSGYLLVSEDNDTIEIVGGSDIANAVFEEDPRYIYQFVKTPLELLSGKIILEAQRPKSINTVDYYPRTMSDSTKQLNSYEITKDRVQYAIEQEV